MKFKKSSALACALCISALSVFADAPTSTVATRNSLLFNGYFISNAVPTITNINAFTNLYLSAPSQHNISVTTIITGTNAIVPATLNYTNYFDLAKILVSNGVFYTNWTTDQPIQVIGTGTGVTNSVQARLISTTNFDSYDLLRLTKQGMNATNNYFEQVILGQTP